MGVRLYMIYESATTIDWRVCIQQADDDAISWMYVCMYLCVYVFIKVCMIVCMYV